MNDMFPWVMLATTMITTIVVSISVSRSTIKHLCKQETKKLHYGPYSNGAYFNLAVDKKRLRGNKLEVSGPYEGKLPGFNNIVHIYIGNLDVGASVRRSHKEGDRAYLKLFLSEKFDLNYLTNVTTSRKARKNVNDYLLDTLVFPFTITKPFIQNFASVLMIIIGGTNIFIGIAGDVIFITIIGLFLFGFGIYITLENLLSSLTFIDEETVNIKSLRRNGMFNLGDIRLSFSVDEKELLKLTLFDKEDNKTLGVYGEASKHFFEALTAIDNYEKKHPRIEDNPEEDIEE